MVINSIYNSAKIACIIRFLSLILSSRAIIVSVLFTPGTSSAGTIIATIDEGSANGSTVTLNRTSAGIWTCSHSLSASVSLTGC